MIGFHLKKSNSFITIVIAVFISLYTIQIHVVASEYTTVSIDPSTQIISPQSSFTVNVTCAPEVPIKSYEFKISYDASLVQANTVTEGDIFEGYETFFNAGTINNDTGTIIDIYGLIVGAGTVADPGTLVSISFTATELSGTSDLTLYDVGVTNSSEYIDITVTNGTVTVQNYTLSVTTVGNGEVTKDPDQLYYDYGDIVELTAVPEDGWSFLEWTGDLSGSENPDTITITGNMSVTATFVDSSSPQISDIQNDTSDPLDTDELYGWINITCTVEDNVGITSVSLNITNSDSSWNNVSMYTSDDTNYYYNTSSAFSEAGNYSYCIWACDTEYNEVTSSSHDFSMPANWDINLDGSCNVYDLVLVSNEYNSTGNNGWTRADVDNNGEIQVLDLVFLSEHYDESWWD